MSGPNVNGEALSGDERQHKNIFAVEDELPAPTANVAKQIQSLSPASQREATTNLFNFLKEPSSSLLTLNSDDTPYTFLLHIPGTSKVKLCYGLGVGMSALGKTSPLDGKFLTLTEDGGPSLGFPSPFVFSNAMRQVEKMPVMTDNQFLTTLSSKGPLYQVPLVLNAQVKTEAEIMKMAPIPTYLVYDGFESDLEIGLVYE
jgi:hypothetical protein